MFSTCPTSRRAWLQQAGKHLALPDATGSDHLAFDDPYEVIGCTSLSATAPADAAMALACRLRSPAAYSSRWSVIVPPSPGAATRATKKPVTNGSLRLAGRFHLGELHHIDDVETRPVTD